MNWCFFFSFYFHVRLILAAQQTNKWLRQQTKNNKNFFDFHKIHRDDVVQKKIDHDLGRISIIFKKKYECANNEKPRSSNYSFNHYTWLTFNLKHKCNHFVELTSSKTRKENWEKGTYKTSEEYRRRTGHVLYTECKIALLVQNSPGLVQCLFSILIRKTLATKRGITHHFHLCSLSKDFSIHLFVIFFHFYSPIFLLGT